MPIYEYLCDREECGEKHSEVRTIAEYDANGPRSSCPKCKKHSLERIYNGYGGFNLSGRDWPSKQFKRVGR